MHAAIGTTFREIVDYWSSRKFESDISVDWSEATKRCWRCTQRRKLQRCHIVPRSLGGSEEPSNLVLLCGQCHLEAPNVDDPDFIWEWLKAHAQSEYGLYWVERGHREYEFLYGRKAFSDIAAREDASAVFERMHAALICYLERTTRHWGQGQLNAATWAWVIRNAEKDAGLP